MRYIEPDKSHTKKAIGFNKHAEYSRCEGFARDRSNYAKAREWFKRAPYSMRGAIAIQ